MPNRLYIPATDVAEYPNGLLSVADITDGDGKWLTGVEYESDLCGPDLNIANLLCAPPNGTNEVQTATITGAPTGGTWTITAYGETTSTLSRTASAAQVQAALEALQAFSPSDVTVGGTGPWTITFTGQYAAQDVPLMTAAHTFTGGTSPNVAIATTTPGSRTPKVTQEENGTTSADPFTLFVLRACRGIGDYERASSRAQALLRGAEQRGVEKGVWSIMTAVGAGAVDLTGASAVKPEVGLATLEYWASQFYANTPTIHVPRDVGSILSTKGAIERHGNHMESGLGAKVSAGGGYAKTGINAAAPVSGEAWMFVTGGVRLWRGTANIKGPLFTQGAAMDNTQVVLAERSYMAAMDCILAGIRVTVTA